MESPQLLPTKSSRDWRNSPQGRLTAFERLNDEIIGLQNREFWALMMNGLGGNPFKRRGKPVPPASDRTIDNWIQHLQQRQQEQLMDLRESLAPGSTNLLIVGCSQSKTKWTGNLPALERYDGPMFKMLRKFGRSRFGGRWQSDWPNLQIWILSARYGLLHATTEIPDYDWKINEARAVELKERVTKRLEALAQLNFDQVYLDLGKNYQKALPDHLTTLFPTMTYGQGAIGVRVSAVRAWLNTIYE